jgi:hypothetical protein
MEMTLWLRNHVTEVPSLKDRRIFPGSRELGFKCVPQAHVLEILSPIRPYWELGPLRGDQVIRTWINMVVMGGGLL